jgi:hypothetical protein
MRLALTVFILFSFILALAVKYYRPSPHAHTSIDIVSSSAVSSCRWNGVPDFFSVHPVYNLTEGALSRFPPGDE